MENQHKKLISTIIVLAGGMVIGFLVWNIWFNNDYHNYPLDFKQGQWIVAPDKGPQAYFVKEVYITNPIRHAWIIVAGTDSFALYINGKTIDSKGYASVNVSGMYDIGSYLHQGKNVLGVVVRRISYPGPAMTVVEGAYIDQLGNTHLFYTDDSWKSSAVEQRQGSGEILWHSELFDAALWSSAISTGQPNSSDIYPLDVHPSLFTMPPQGKWVRRTDSGRNMTAFSYTLMLPAKIEDAWIRIAAAKPYSLTINGVNLDGEMQTNSMFLKLPDIKIQNNDSEASTDIFNIASLIHSGVNRIAISTGVQSVSLAGLFVDGFVITNRKKLFFGTDSTWKMNVSEGIGGDSPITVLADNVQLPPKIVMNKKLPLSYTAKQAAKFLAVLLIIGLITFIFWKGAAKILKGLQSGNSSDAEALTAFAFLPILLLFGGLFLLSFDIRFDPMLPFHNGVVWLLLAVLLFITWALLLEVWYRKKYGIQRYQIPLKNYLSGDFVYWVIIIFLIVTGAFLRLNSLDSQSLYHDEIHMVRYVQGFFERGYPYKMIGPIERPLATYELIPYPIASSIKLFGFNEFAFRLPAALFGTAMILLIYFIGKQFFDRRVGLLSAAIYAFCPQALLWAKSLWHPQQVQFFALLTSYFFCRAINQKPSSPYYLYISVGMFIVTYLSWEGAGFLLPAFILSIFAVKRKDLSWLKDKHTWIAGGVVTAAVALQLTRRLLQQYPYIVVGAGLSDVSLPTLYFLDPMYDPFYYMKNFLWLDNNAILTILTLTGMPFLFKHKEFSYYFTILFSILLMMTNLLSNAAIRYVYYLQPFLILLASTAFFFILDNVTNILQNSRVQIIWLTKRMVILTSCIMVIMGTGFFMKLYRISNFSAPTGIHIRQDSYYIDYRGPAHYIKAYYQQGDLVISVVPDALRYYSNINTQYYAENYAIRQVLFDPSESTPRYLERIEGVPVVRGISELNEVINHSRRIWIVAVPYSVFSILAGPEITKYINREGKVVYESYNGRVYLLER